MSKFLSPSFEDNQGSTFAFAYGFYDWPLGSLAHSPRPWSRGRATSGRWGRCRSWGTCRRGWASRALLEAKREAILKLGFMMLGWGVSYKYKIYINGVNKNIMHIYIYTWEIELALPKSCQIISMPRRQLQQIQDKKNMPRPPVPAAPVPEVPRGQFQLTPASAKVRKFHGGLSSQHFSFWEAYHIKEISLWIILFWFCFWSTH